MIRSRLAFLKHIVLALLALAVLPCAVEVGLRIDDWRNDPETASAPQDEILQTPCRVLHHVLVPLTGVSLKDPDSGAKIFFRTNSFGLRGAEVDVPKSTGVFRIVCLGDERTLSPGVDEGATFSARLEKLLQSRSRMKIEVVNAGVPDYCPLLGYLQLRHSLLALQPDLVIYHFDMSDISDDHRHRRHTRMSPEGVPLACTDPTLDAKRKSAGQRLEERFLLVKWGRTQLGRIPVEESSSASHLDIDAPHGRYEWLRDNPPDWSIHIEQALVPLEQMARLVEGSFGRFALAICPAPWQAAANATTGGGVRARFGIPENMRFESRRPFEIVAQFVAQHGLAVCNTVDPILQAKKPEELYLRNSPELSPLGHDLYARRLAQYVIANVPGIWMDASDGSRLQPVSGSRPVIRH